MDLARSIVVVLPNGVEREYFPPHSPVVGNSHAGTLGVTWQEDDGSVFSVAINMEQVSVMEMTSTREEQEEELLELIDRAKNADEKEEEA